MIEEFIPQNAVNPSFSPSAVAQASTMRDQLEAGLLQDLFRDIRVVHTGAHEIQQLGPLGQQQVQRRTSLLRLRVKVALCHFSVRLLVPYIGFIPLNRKGFLDDLP